MKVRGKPFHLHPSDSAFGEIQCNARLKKQGVRKSKVTSGFIDKVALFQPVGPFGLKVESVLTANMEPTNEFPSRLCVKCHESLLFVSEHSSFLRYSCRFCKGSFRYEVIREEGKGIAVVEPSPMAFDIITGKLLDLEADLDEYEGKVKTISIKKKSAKKIFNPVNAMRKIKLEARKKIAQSGGFQLD